jgi:hypothetical protein
MAVKIRKGDDRDFVLLINCGDRQEVKQAHFHLFTANLTSRAIESSKIKKIGKDFTIVIQFIKGEKLRTFTI